MKDKFYKIFFLFLVIIFLSDSSFAASSKNFQKEFTNYEEENNNFLKDKNIRLFGFTHSDYRSFFNDYGDEVNNRFVNRRLRVISTGVFDKISYRLMTESNQNSPTFFDAFIDYAITPEVNVRFGKFRSPLSLERWNLANDTMLIERGYTTQFAPGWDMGSYFWGLIANKRLEYNIGVTGGARDFANPQHDFDDKKDFMLKLFSFPLRGNGEVFENLGVGFSYSVGERDGDLRKRQVSNYNTTSFTRIFSYCATCFADGIQTRFLPQGYWYYKNFGLLSEYAINESEINNNAGLITQVNNNAWGVTASYMLTGENFNFNQAVLPFNEFSLKDKGLGAFQVAARVSGISFDEASFANNISNISNSVKSANSQTIGVNWFPTKELKLMLNYETTQFEGGGLSGADRQDEHVILSRLQIRFNWF
ncbi:MAG: porin [Rickettsiales bacterium]|nr:porin [Rickettsiales bacterium]